MLAFQLLLTVSLAASSFAQDEDCIPCVNLWERCESKWTVVDCQRDDVVQNCPLLCGTCRPCGEPGAEPEMTESVEKVDGGFSDWVSVIGCREGCIAGDVQVQSRDCNNPMPHNGGMACLGSYVQISECEGCGNAALAEELTDVVQELQEVESSCGSHASGDSVQGSSDETLDEEGKRLAFRHTGMEIAVKEAVHFYKSGGIRGQFVNSPAGGQYRDPNFHFYWGDTTNISLNIFNLEGNKDAWIRYDIPTSHYLERPTWSGIFNTYNYLSTEDQFFTDVLVKASRDPASPVFDNSFDRYFYLPRNHGGCAKDAIWFTVIGTDSVVCNWDKRLRKPDGEEKLSYIYYSSTNTAGLARSMLQMASKFEMRITGGFSPEAQNGYRRVFRYPQGAGVHVLDYFTDGVTDPTLDRSSLTASYVRTADMYRSDDILAELTSASKVMVVIYQGDGKVFESLTFNGNGDSQSWFAPENLVSTQWWELPKSFTMFTLGNSVDRYFYIANKHSLCTWDEGFLTVSCKRADGSRSCGWEDFTDGSNLSKGQLCSIMFAPGTESIRWESGNYRIASAIEVFVK